eukprot:10279095-Karenia_brevis.AAC.1
MTEVCAARELAIMLCHCHAKWKWIDMECRVEFKSSYQPLLMTCLLSSACTLRAKSRRTGHF